MAFGLVRQDGAHRPGARCSAAQAEVILTTIAELFQELDSHREFQKRIQGIDRDAERFAADVERLDGTSGPGSGISSRRGAGTRARQPAATCTS